MTSPKSAYLKYLAALLIFGSNGLLVTKINLTSGQIVLTRTILGSVFLLIIACCQKKLNLRAALRNNVRPVFVAGAALGANWIFLFAAYRSLSVSIATLIYYCGPILVMALSPFIFHERLTWNKLAAILVVLAGMVCITGVFANSVVSGWGLFCGSMAALLYALIIIANKFIHSASGMNLSILQLAIAFAIVLVYLLATGQLPFALPQGRVLLYIVILGIGNTGLAYWLYFSALQQLPSQTVALCSYLDPVSTVIFSALFLGEQLNDLQLVGALCILGGALLGELRFARTNT